METRTIQARMCDKYFTVKLVEGGICNKNDEIFSIIGMGDTELESMQQAFDNVCVAYESCMEAIDFIMEDIFYNEDFEIDEEFISRNQEIARSDSFKLKYRGFGYREEYPKERFVIIHKVDAGYYDLAVERL